MALRIELKPRERFILGGAVLQNGDARSELILENNVPILRGKNILSLEEADTPCKRIYFLIQLMYVEGGNLAEHQDAYWALVRDIVKAAPSMLGLIDAINEHTRRRPLLRRPQADPETHQRRGEVNPTCRLRCRLTRTPIRW